MAFKVKLVITHTHSTWFWEWFPKEYYWEDDHFDDLKTGLMFLGLSTEGDWTECMNHLKENTGE